MDEWKQQAKFMREEGATHAEWDPLTNRLTVLTLGPDPSAKRLGPAAQLAERHLARDAKHRHDVRFAASTVKPIFEQPPPPPSAVPRAVRAKEEAARRGKTG
jgi:hypothetical protein